MNDKEKAMMPKKFIVPPKKETIHSLVVLAILIISVIVILVDFFQNLSFSWLLFVLILFVSGIILYEAKRQRDLGIQYDDETIEAYFSHDLSLLKGKKTSIEVQRSTINLEQIVSLDRQFYDEVGNVLRFVLKDETNRYVLLTPYYDLQIDFLITFLRRKMELIENSDMFQE
ncbi:MAG: hypothetical protein JXL85_05905 [Bacilli bacterium]|nr:hypothetical protein [Bacilli bacterium]